jgi:shikimate dehydrogenase
LSNEAQRVIAVGGGIPIELRNQILLKNHLVINVTAPKGVVFERIMVNGWPAFFPQEVDPYISFQKLWLERTPHYDALAIMTINNNNSLDVVVENIINKLSQQIHNGVIGFPLTNSLSPKLHNAIYKTKQINAEMTSYAGENIEELVQLIRNKPLTLVAVTIPHKQTIMSYLDVIDEPAQAVGAVNTVINRNGVLIGYNTDIIGIKHALTDIKINNKNVLIVGAGGAAYAVAAVIKSEQGNIYCLNRTEFKAKQLIEKFGGKIFSLNQPLDIVINTVPDWQPILESIITSHMTVFDIVYNPIETKLLKLAKQRGAKTISGITMFEAQGRAQIELWLTT